MRRPRIWILAGLTATLLTVVVVVSAMGAPIARTASLFTGPTGIADPDTADTFFTGTSDDARTIIFETTQRLTADDNDGGLVDIYRRSGGVTTLVTKATGVTDPESRRHQHDGQLA